VSTSQGNFRYLTAGEICLSRMVFGDAIDYSRVKIYNGKWIFMQRKDVVMTPNGNIYYPEGLFRDDFSATGPGDINLRIFIHEMAHVWQHQRGYSVKSSGIFSFDKSRYRYELNENKRLSDYNMEAQANLLSDYFLLLKFGELGSRYLFEPTYKNREQGVLLPLYKSVLSDFISNPHDENNLPGRRRDRREEKREPQPGRENH